MILDTFKDKYFRIHLKLKCEKCDSEYTQQKRVFQKASWKFRCPKCRWNICKSRQDRPTLRCLDCSKLIWRGSKKCKSCARKTHRPDNFCTFCKRKISNKINQKTKILPKSCRGCHNVRQDQGKSRARTKFNASRKWAKLREKCFERDNFICQKCFKRGGYLNAHHIKSYAEYPSLRLDLDNLLTLCQPCHKVTHGWGSRNDS